MTTALMALCAVTSILLCALVLAHRGSGGGLSDLFGGAGSAVSSSAHANRNLTRITLVTGALWLGSIVTLGVLA